MTRHRITHLSLQIVRRGVQLAVAALVVALVFLSLYAHYHAAHALDDPQFTKGIKGGVLVAIDRRLAGAKDVNTFLDGYKGTLWSMRVGGIDLTDPLAAAEMLAASRTVHVPMLISIAIPVFVTLLFGKVFCSWICPAGLLFEITGKLRKLLRLAELRPANVRFSWGNKYVLLAVGLLMAVAFGLPMFTLIYPPAVLSRLAHAWIFGTAMTGMLVLLGLIIAFEVFVSPRWWCRTMCPGGALYGLLGWSRLVRVRLDVSRCTGCKMCIPVCEPGLDPVHESSSIECDNCGVCIKHCDDKALYYTIGLPGQRRHHSTCAPAASAQTARRKARAAAVAVTLLLGAFARPAAGHHILGIPHYSYRENYPQAPTLEYPATSGPYDILLTSYPGRPVPGEPANLAVYIKNRNTGEPFEEPIAVRVLETFTFGRSGIVLEPTVVHPFEQPHKLTARLPRAGEYVIEVTLDVEGQPETIPFVMVAGEPTATASVVIAFGVGLALFVIIVRAVRIKRDRRMQASMARTAARATTVAVGEG